MAANTQELQKDFKQAIDEDNSERVLVLLDEHKPDIDAQIILASPAIQHAGAVPQAETLLQYAGRMGSKKVVEALIRQGAKVENEFTALFVADHPLGTLANPDLIALFKAVFDFAGEQQGEKANGGKIRALKSVQDLKGFCKSFDASIAKFKPTIGEDPVSGTIKGEREKMTAHLVWAELKRFLDDQTHAGNPREMSIEFLKRIALLPATIQLRLGYSKLQDFKNDKANSVKIEKIQVTPFGSETVLTGMAALEYFSQTLYSAINGTNAVSPETQQAILVKIDEIIAGEEQVISFAQEPYRRLPVPETHPLNIDEFITGNYFKLPLSSKKYQHQQGKMVSSSGESLSAQSDEFVLSTSHELPVGDVKNKTDLHGIDESGFSLAASKIPGQGGHTVKIEATQGAVVEGSVEEDASVLTTAVLPSLHPVVPQSEAEKGFEHGFIPLTDRETVARAPGEKERDGDGSWKEKSGFSPVSPETRDREKRALEERGRAKEKRPDPADLTDEESDENFLFSWAQQFFEDEEAASNGRILGGASGVDDEGGAAALWGVPIVSTLTPSSVLPPNPLGAPLFGRAVSDTVNIDDAGVCGMAGGGYVPPTINNPRVGYVAPLPAVFPRGVIARVDLSGVSSLYNAAHRVYQYLQKADGHQHISLPVMRLFSTLNQFKAQDQLKAVTLSNGKTIWETLNPEEKDKFKVESLVGIAAQGGILGTAIAAHKNYQVQYTDLLAQVGGQYRPTGKKYYFQRSEADLIELIVLRDGETLTPAEMREATHQLIVICQDVFDKVQVDVCVYDNPLFKTHSGIDLLKQTVITVASQGVELQAADKAKPQDHGIQKEACELKQKMVEPAPEFKDIEEQKDDFVNAETTMNWIGSTREETLKKRGIRIMTDKGRVLPKISDTAQDEQTELRREYWTEVMQWEKDQKDWGSIVSATDILMNVLAPLELNPNLYQKDGIYAHLMPLGEGEFKLFDSEVEEQRKKLEKWATIKRDTRQSEMAYSESDVSSSDEREEQRQALSSRYNSTNTFVPREGGSLLDNSDDEEYAHSEDDYSQRKDEGEDQYFVDTGDLGDLDSEDQHTTVRLRVQQEEHQEELQGERKREQHSSLATIHVRSRKRTLWPSSASSSTAPQRIDMAEELALQGALGAQRTLEIVTQDSKVTAQALPKVVAKTIPGFDIEDVPDDGNCFYHALVRQFEIIAPDRLNAVPDDKEPHEFFRTKVEGRERDMSSPEDQDLFVKDSDFDKISEELGIIIAVINIEFSGAGFRCYLGGGQRAVFPSDLPPDGDARPIIRLAYNGDHFMPVLGHQPLSEGALRTAYDTRSSASRVLPITPNDSMAFFHKSPQQPPVAQPPIPVSLFVGGANQGRK